MIGVRPLIADKLLEFSCTCLPIADGTLLGGNLSVSPDVGGDPHVPHRLEGPVHSRVDCELLIQEQEV